MIDKRVQLRRRAQHTLRALVQCRKVHGEGIGVTGPLQLLPAPLMLSQQIVSALCAPAGRLAILEVLEVVLVVVCALDLRPIIGSLRVIALLSVVR